MITPNICYTQKDVSIILEEIIDTIDNIDEGTGSPSHNKDFWDGLLRARDIVDSYRNDISDRYTLARYQKYPSEKQG